MGARLLLAFLVVATFGALAAASAIYALHQLGNRFEIVDARLPRAVSALELSRSAERIVATAPALLAAGDQSRREEVNATLESEINRLLGTLDELKDSDAGLPLSEIEPIVSSLADNLALLEEVVARRLEVSARLGELRRSITDLSRDIDRLLAPWVEVVESEIAKLSGASGEDGSVSEGAAPQLASHLNLQRDLRASQVKATAIAEMLGEASASNQPQRIQVLAFQLDRALDELETLAGDFDPRLRSMLRLKIDELRAFTTSRDSIPLLREEELSLLGDGQRLVSEIGRRSTELMAAVDQLGGAAKAEIGGAVQDALALQRISSRLLVAIVAASLLTSILIVWLYVGRNIVRRLNALSEGTLAIASGDLDAEVPAEGSDEITAMAKAVETFRKNTLERDGLLLERAQAADRLEKVVRKRTAELEQKSRELENASKFKSRFLTSASHDLRQPLHALNLFVSQLHTERDPAERDRLVGRIDAAVGSMNDLFDALLDMAKLEAGIIEPNVQDFPIQPLLARIQATFSAVAREKGLRLGVVGNRSWVTSDPVLLERLLINLVSNAVRYTMNGGVVVGCRRRGETLRIEVWDTGIGFSEDDQSRILGEFVQLAPGGTGAQGGLGLGLSIVSRLADFLGHRLEIASRVGIGSRFAIVVPLTTKREEAVEPLRTAAIPDTAPGTCILVMDDDPLALDGMRGILQSWGCKVIAAPDPAAAQGMLAEPRSRPDLIISDLHLGNGQTGIEAIERIRSEIGAPIPAFLISGDTTPDRVQEAREQGYHLLHKPVAPMRLRAMVSRMTSRADAKSETVLQL